MGSFGASEASPAPSGRGIKRRRRVLSEHTKEKDEEERGWRHGMGLLKG